MSQKKMTIETDVMIELLRAEDPLWGDKGLPPTKLEERDIRESLKKKQKDVGYPLKSGFHTLIIRGNSVVLQRILPQRTEEDVLCEICGETESQVVNNMRRVFKLLDEDEKRVCKNWG